VFDVLVFFFFFLTRRQATGRIRISYLFSQSVDLRRSSYYNRTARRGIKEDKYNTIPPTSIMYSRCLHVIFSFYLLNIKLYSTIGQFKSKMITLLLYLSKHFIYIYIYIYRMTSKHAYHYFSLI